MKPTEPGEDHFSLKSCSIETAEVMKDEAALGSICQTGGIQRLDAHKRVKNYWRLGMELLHSFFQKIT